MTYKIIITDSAFKDLEEIKSFIANDNLSAAKKYVGTIFDKLKSLSTLPRRGLKISNCFFDYAKAYYLICLNHVAIYQINELTKCVYVLRVLSHFQDWKNIVNKELLNKEEIIIESNRLRLLKMNQTMYYDVYRNSLDEDNKKYVPDEVFDSLEEASETVDQMIDNCGSQDGPFVYAVIRKEDNVNIGYVQLAKIVEDWEIGYHIAKLFAGNNYATEAVKIFIDYLKKNTDLKEIYGITLASNKASRMVLEKCGFESLYEGNGIYQGSRRKIIKTIKFLNN